MGCCKSKSRVITKSAKRYCESKEERNRPAHCMYCLEESGYFAHASRRTQHYENNCPMMHLCNYCEQTVEIRNLHEHQMKVCSFLKGSLQPCSKCGIPCSREILQQHDKGQCPGPLSSTSSRRCPLCEEEINPYDNEQQWRDHLIGVSGCLGNERRDRYGCL